MYGHSWKKVIVSSFALGVAGIMTCISALLSDLVPTWSVLAFIAVLIPLGLAIVGILAGFVWLCDKCEEYFNEKKDKLLEGGKRESGKEIITNDQLLKRSDLHGSGNLASGDVHPGIGGVRFNVRLHTRL